MSTGRGNLILDMGKRLLHKLLVPSLHRHVPHVVPNVLRLPKTSQFSNFPNHNLIKNFNFRNQNLRKLKQFLERERERDGIGSERRNEPGHGRLCGYNTEHFPWRIAFRLWFREEVALPSIPVTSFLRFQLLFFSRSLSLRSFTSSLCNRYDRRCARDGRDSFYFFCQNCTNGTANFQFCEITYLNKFLFYN